MKRFCKRAVCLLLTLVLCAGLLPVVTIGASAAMSLAERQKAVVAVAMAYYDKGHSVQYDGATIVDEISRYDGGKTRSTNQVSPEYATPQETMFSVCSDFAHQVYWEFCRYSLCGSAGRNWTHGLCKRPADDKEQAWYWDAETSENKDRNAAIDELLAAAQPGDVVTSITKDGGHTMVYVGDVLGDGTTYIVHCWGSDNRKAKAKGFVDNREYGPDDPTDSRYGVSVYKDSKGGAIRLCPAYDFLHKNYGKDSQVRMNLIRPLNVVTENDYPVTAASKYRASHPRLAIDRYLNITRFRSVCTGEQLTMTLKLSNSSKVDYTVPVTDLAPKGAKIVTPYEGATVSGDTMKWNVTLKAGETKTFTCVFEITAKRGERVVFEGGSVGDVPSNSIPLTVGGRKLTDEDNKTLSDLADGGYRYRLASAGAKASNLGSVVYQKILGLNVQFPEYGTVLKNLIVGYETQSKKKTNRFKTAEEVDTEYQEGYSMFVPSCWGGNKIRYEWGIERCIDPRDKHLEPGDVVVRSNSIMTASSGSQLVYLGNGKYLNYDKKSNSYPLVEEPEFVSCLVDYDVFYVLRPTLAYDDVHTLATPVAADDSMKFTDVKESDWFYTYVKDLVEDGTVNGMTETTFVPNGTLTYGQALKLITLAVGEKEQAKSGTHWASGYLTLAKEKGWIKGGVNLDGTITRLALCRIAAKAKGLSELPAANPFTDTNDRDVLALNKAGVINGMTATEFQPNGLLTRAQISKIIWTLRKA